jgi:hypothetical protein
MYSFDSVCMLKYYLIWLTVVTVDIYLGCAYDVSAVSNGCTRSEPWFLKQLE